MDKNTYQKFHKQPGPETLFSRFLQRQTQEPTEKQLQRWEDEGGVVPEEEDHHEDFDSHKPFGKRMKSYFTRAWKALNSNFNPLEKKDIQ